MPLVDNAFTLLALNGMGVPPYSARGLTQTLQLIAGSAQLRRTINGSLSDVSDPLFRKYASVVTGADIDPPALDGKWAGLQVVVDCIVELGQLESTDPVYARTPVTLPARHEAGFIFYRPRLTMLVTDFNVSTNEYGATTSWTLNLEEV